MNERAWVTVKNAFLQPVKGHPFRYVGDDVPDRIVYGIEAPNDYFLYALSLSINDTDKTLVGGEVLLRVLGGIEIVDEIVIGEAVSGASLVSAFAELSALVGDHMPTTPAADEDPYFTDDEVSPESDPVDLWRRIKDLSAENEPLKAQLNTVRAENSLLRQAASDVCAEYGGDSELMYLTILAHAIGYPGY